jgi:hypothetical protein
MGVHVHPLSLYLPSHTKLWCMLSVERADIHSIYFYLPLYVHCCGNQGVAIYSSLSKLKYLALCVFQLIDAVWRLVNECYCVCVTVDVVSSMNGTNLFCILSSSPLLPPSHHGSVWLLPDISLLVNNTDCIAGAGLPNAYPYDWRGFVGPKKKTSKGHICILHMHIPNCHWSGRKVRLDVEET